ncbi:unnamed protein product [Rotaria socialis]|uniref:SHSP domain-containing protein n=1 Tax=Rotaria socialis TaxID=392032 RepID=A0A821PIG3_9BILA|nr:unnamed protein product [Rotaria socialis]CAF3686787.1 unnamed protein product [Rotaria socialis]CAF4805626.1 unnamed protein product [Rotaria socialis]CAF4809320.1 unnamed protein product [Rotaria socialis]
MSRYYSNSDDVHYASRQRSDGLQASGWQSPLPTNHVIPISSVIRLVIDCPFGSKKCDYSIDKSQQGRLIVTARRRHTCKSDDFSSSNKDNNMAVQTFTIPPDADVDHLESHVERYTNCLIIQIPRLSSSYMNTSPISTPLIRPPDYLLPTTASTTSQVILGDSQLHRNYYDNNRKLEYLIDCNGYTADELDVFIQDYDLMVQGRTRRATSPVPIQRILSKEFSRKISLPTTVDLTKVISYFENGQLRVEAPIKREIYYRDNAILSPESLSTVKYSPVQSPIPGTHQRHYRRQERVSRHREYDRGNNVRSLSPVQRTYSTEGFDYPVYRSTRDLDMGDDLRRSRHQGMYKYERYASNGDGAKLQPILTSVYSPRQEVARARTTHHYYPMDEDMHFMY